MGISVLISGGLLAQEPWASGHASFTQCSHAITSSALPSTSKWAITLQFDHEVSDI